MKTIAVYCLGSMIVRGFTTYDVFHTVQALRAVCKCRGVTNPATAPARPFGEQLLHTKTNT